MKSLILKSLITSSMRSSLAQASQRQAFPRTISSNWLSSAIQVSVNLVSCTESPPMSLARIMRLQWALNSVLSFSKWIKKAWIPLSLSYKFGTQQAKSPSRALPRFSTEVPMPSCWPTVSLRCRAFRTLHTGAMRCAPSPSLMPLSSWWEIRRTEQVSERCPRRQARNSAATTIFSSLLRHRLRQTWM